MKPIRFKLHLILKIIISLLFKFILQDSLYPIWH